ncbi:uncharacterized protein LOC116106614 [Pistacia vera]|uniref:uncharacterized protein LOC116106614 n=1 Tax=Pistacia vera TaxID=55513 RepID=UPI001263E459|nr:uncharacterized protein LOC116106614 [Pistacia vera]
MTLFIRQLFPKYGKIKVNGTRVFGIHCKIVNLTQGTNTVVIYYNKLKSLWDELDSLVSLPAPDSISAKAYLDHLNQQKLLQFLMGLNESYSMVQSLILLMNPLPTVKQAYLVVNQDESQRVLIGMNVNSEFTRGKTNSKSKLSTNQVQTQNSTSEVSDVNNVNMTVGPVLTSEQYNQILQLLGKENIASPADNLASLPNGTRTHIKHVGSIDLDNGIHLSKVLHDLCNGKLKGIDNNLPFDLQLNETLISPTSFMTANLSLPFPVDTSFLDLESVSSPVIPSHTDAAQITKLSPSFVAQPAIPSPTSPVSDINSLP